MARHWPRRGAAGGASALGIGMACLLATPQAAQAQEESAIARAVPCALPRSGRIAQCARKCRQHSPS